MMYVQDYDERTITDLTDYPEGQQRPWQRYESLLYPYLKSVAVYKCPSNGHTCQGNICKRAWQFEPMFQNMTPGYGVNGYIVNMSLASISEPAITLVLADSWHEISACPQSVAWPEGGCCFPGVSASFCGTAADDTIDKSHATRHQGGSNIIFCDGHAKWLKSEAIWAARPIDGQLPLNYLRWTP
jgi:prepilin-type processing-associated H-X9-DG protein